MRRPWLLLALVACEPAVDPVPGVRPTVLANEPAARHEWFLAGPPAWDVVASPRVALSDGRLLVVGRSQTTEGLFPPLDPRDAVWLRSPLGEWSAGAPLPIVVQPRFARQLRGGSVWVAGRRPSCERPVPVADPSLGPPCKGGPCAGSVPTPASVCDGLLAFDPDTGRWTTRIASRETTWTTSVELTDGRVLLLGNPSSELLGPSGSRPVLPSPDHGVLEGVVAARVGASVLVVGSAADGCHFQLYEPAADRWRRIRHDEAACQPTFALSLADGSALVGLVGRILRYTPTDGRWDATELGAGRVVLGGTHLGGDRALLVVHTPDDLARHDLFVHGSHGLVPAGTFTRSLTFPSLLADGSVLFLDAGLSPTAIRSMGHLPR